MQLSIKPDDDRTEPGFPEDPEFRHKSLEERAFEYGGSLYYLSEFDWGEPEGREVW